MFVKVIGSTGRDVYLNLANAARVEIGETSALVQFPGGQVGEIILNIESVKHLRLTLESLSEVGSRDAAPAIDDWWEMDAPKVMETEIISMDYSEQPVNTETARTWLFKTRNGRIGGFSDLFDPEVLKLFSLAGYGVDLYGMEVGERLDWSRCPIGIRLGFTEDGLQIIAVKGRTSTDDPDIELAAEQSGVAGSKGRLNGSGFEVVDSGTGVQS